MDAFFSVTASILLPCMCYLKIYKTGRGFGFEFIVIVGLLVAGTIVGVVGTYTSVKKVVTHLWNRDMVYPNSAVFKCMDVYILML